MMSRRTPSAHGCSGTAQVALATLPRMSTLTSRLPAADSTARRMFNKVPEVTLYFWVIKIMCTTIGETAADYLNDNLGFGLTNTTYVAGALLIALLVWQFRLRKYVPPVYWAVVVVISVFGTLITDNLTDGHNVPLTTSTPIFAVILALVFAVWWGVERTLSIHTIVTTRREAFYWLAILFTFALGTAGLTSSRCARSSPRRRQRSNSADSDSVWMSDAYIPDSRRRLHGDWSSAANPYLQRVQCVPYCAM